MVLGSTVPAAVRVAFKSSSGRRDIGAELVGSWQYGASVSQYRRHISKINQLEDQSCITGLGVVLSQ